MKQGSIEIILQNSDEMVLEVTETFCTGAVYLGERALFSSEAREALFIEDLIV